MKDSSGFWWFNVPKKYRKDFILSNSDIYDSGLIDFFNEEQHEDKIILYLDDPKLKHAGLYEYGTNMKRLHLLAFERELPFLPIEQLKELANFEDIDLADNSLNGSLKRLSRSQAEKLLKVFDSNGQDESTGLTDDDRVEFTDDDGMTFADEGDEEKNKSKANSQEIELIKYNSYSLKDSSLSPVFQVDQIADVFADHLIEFKKDNGQMLCVTGRWGRGKTYFIKRLCNKLNIDYDKET